MKKIITAAALALTLALGACGGSSDDKTPTAEPTASASASPSLGLPELGGKTSDAEENFLTVVFNETSYRGDDETLLELGHNLCELTEQNGVRSTFYTLLDDLESNDASQDDARDFGFIYATAVGFLCPEYTDEMARFVDQFEEGQGA